jgi:hypothetical protein
MIKLPLLVTLLAALGMIGLACGGGSDNKATATVGASATQAASSSAESQYFTQVAAIFLTGQTGTAAANDALNTSLDAAQTLDEKKTAITAFLDSMIGVFDQSATDMGGLDPPAAAKDAHDLFLGDIRAAKQKSSDLKAQLGGVASDDDLNAIIDQFNSEVDPIVADSNSACKSLQTLADSDGITVDLSCGG